MYDIEKTESQSIETQIQTVQGVIDESLAEIRTHVERIGKLVVDSYVDKVKGIVVTDDNLPFCKDIKTEINGRIKVLEEHRKLLKKTFSEPAKEVDAIFREQTSKLQDVKETLDEGIKEFDIKKRKEREAVVQTYIEEIAGEYGIDPSLIEFKESWGNVTATKKGIRAEINDQCKLIIETQRIEQQRRDMFSAMIDLENETLDKKLTMEDFEHLINAGLDNRAIITEIRSKADILRRNDTPVEEEPKAGTLVKLRIYDPSFTPERILHILEEMGCMVTLES